MSLNYGDRRRWCSEQYEFEIQIASKTCTTPALLAWDYLQRRKMIGKFIDHCLLVKSSMKSQFREKML